MTSSITETNRRGVSALSEHRRQGGWTSTPYTCGGSSGSGGCDELAGERLPKQRPHLIDGRSSFVCSKAWLALSGASAGGFVSPGSNVGLSTLAFSGVPVLAVCVSCFSRGAIHAGVCRFPSVFVDLPGVIQCLWTR